MSAYEMTTLFQNKYVMLKGFRRNSQMSECGDGNPMSGFKPRPDPHLWLADEHVHRCIQCPTGKRLASKYQVATGFWFLAFMDRPKIRVLSYVGVLTFASVIQSSNVLQLSSCYHARFSVIIISLKTDLLVFRTTPYIKNETVPVIAKYKPPPQTPINLQLCF